MALTNCQIDKLSKKYVKLNPKGKSYAKLVHKRKMRRKSKNVNNPNPQYNRYNGYIG